MSDSASAKHIAAMNTEPWRTALRSRLPLLLTGSVSTTNDCLSHLRRHLPPPIVDIACDAGLTANVFHGPGTVVLHNVDRLAPAEQHRLLGLLDDSERRPQVISTASRPLFPLVGDGRFLENLYYRLNLLYFDALDPATVEGAVGVHGDSWLEEFPTEVHRRAVVAAAEPTTASIIPSIKSAVAPLFTSKRAFMPAAAGLLTPGSARSSVAACAFGIVIGALSMWAITGPRPETPVAHPVNASTLVAQREPSSPLPPATDASPATVATVGGPPRAAVNADRIVPVAAPSATTQVRRAVRATPRTTPAVARTPTNQVRLASSTRSSRYRGALSVNSRPAGAQVSINGQPIGVTPLVVNSLPVGSRAVRMTVQGYHPWSSAVQVVANQRTSVVATLQRLPE